MRARMKQKGIEGNMVGRGGTKGGILCIAPDGELVYSYKEEPGKGVPADIRARIEVDADKELALEKQRKHLELKAFELHAPTEVRVREPAYRFRDVGRKVLVLTVSHARRPERGWR